MRHDLRSETPLDTYTKANLEYLEKLPSVVKPVSTRRVGIAAGEAMEFRYGMTLGEQSGQKAAWAITQYTIVKGNSAFVISLTCPDREAESHSPIFEKIGKGFQLLR